MSGDPPSKKDQLLKLLERGSVFVHLDPRREGVVVPPWLGRKPQLVLQLGLNFAIPIPDLTVDAAGVRCTLSFNRAPFFCNLPWAAVYALVAEDGQVTVWPTELPSELVPETSPVRKGQPTSRSPRSRQRPRISVVPPPADDPSAAPPSIPAAPRAPAVTQLPLPVPSLAPMPAPASSLLPPPAGEAPHSPASSRDERANDSLSVRPQPGAEPRKRPPYLRLVK